MPFGIPDGLLVLGVIVVAIVIGLTQLSKGKGKRKARRGKTPPVKEKKPDITQLIGKPESHPEPKQVKSVEEMLVGNIDNAPSIGSPDKTNITSTLSMLKFEEEDSKPKGEKPPAQVKRAPMKHTPPKEQKKEENLASLEEEKPVEPEGIIDLDEFKSELEEPEDYMNPPSVTPAKIPKAPPPVPPRSNARLKQVREELEKGLSKSVLKKDAPMTISDKGTRYFCMEHFDLGMSPVKVATQLRKHRVHPSKAKAIVNQTYSLWLEKREPVIMEIKEIHERMKRIHYKFLKMQIDEKTRREMLVENQKKLIELEAHLKATDSFFED